MTVLARPEVILGGSSAPLDRAISAASAKLQQAGARMQAMGARFSAAITLPLIGIGAAATKATADWETAMVGVQKTVDATAEQIDRLGDSFVRMSERIPVAAGELAGIAAEAGQLGIATENLLGFTEAVAALRVATNLGDQAASTLARLANIMGTAQTDFDRMGSTIVDLGNNLATTEAEIADMALRIAGAGRQIGLTEAQVLGFAGALSSVGVRSEAGGTAISRVMVDIATAVEQGGGALQRFAAVAGMTVDEFRERFETDGAGAITAFITGLGELEGQGKSTFGTLEELGLADIRVRDVLLRASAASDIFTDALDRGTTAWEENTALSREAGLFFNRLAARFEILRNKAGNITAELGDALRPAIDRVIAGVDRLLNVARNLVQWFAQLDPQLRIQVALWTGIVAAIGPVAIVLGTVISLFGAVLGTIAAVGTTLVGLAAIVVAVKNNWLGLGEAAARAWDTIVSAADVALTAIVDFVKPVANFLIGFFVGTARAAFESWDIIRYEFGRAFDWIREKARPILAGIATGLEVIGRIGARAAGIVGDAFAGAADAIRNALTDAGDEGEEGGRGIAGRIASGFADAFATDYVGAFVSIVRDGIDKARAFIAAAIERLRALAGGGVIVEELEAAQVVLDGLGDVITQAAGTGRRGFDAMAEGITQLQGAAVDFAAEFAFALGDAVLDGIEAFKRFGAFVIRTLAQIAAKLVIFKALSAIFPGSQLVTGLAKQFGFAGTFAHGGRIPAGQWGIAGEAGTEVVTRPTAVMGPADVTPGGGDISFSFSFPPARSPTDAARDPEIARMFAEQVRNALSNGLAFG